MMRNALTTSTLLAVMLLASPPASAAELSVGVARVDLTPPAEMKASLGGYGERMGRPAEGIHDRVFAKTVVLSDGQRHYAILTADILGFPPGFKAALVEELAEKGWSDEQIMLLPSHSHTSIDMMAIHPKNVFPIPQIGIYSEKLFRFTIERCATAIEKADADLVPAAIGTATTQLDGWNRNRRRGETRADNQLIVTRIDAADGKPLAALVNFTAHPTFLSAQHMLFSAGWPGQLQRSLESMIDGESKSETKVTVLYFQWRQGDQSPVGRPNSGSDRWEAAEMYGRELAVEAHAVWNHAATARDVAFDFHLQSFELPQNSWHPSFMKTGGTEYALSQTILEKMLPMMFPRQTTSGSLRLGDLVIVGIPGELGAGLGLDIKAKTKELTGASHVAIGGLANEWISYILTAEQYARGGYESSVSFYGPGLGKCVVEGVLAGVKALKSENRSK